MTRKQARPRNEPYPRTDHDTYDHELTNTIYELIHNVETQDVFAIRLAYGHLTGVHDCAEDEDAPSKEGLSALHYDLPSKTDGVNLARDRDQWVTTARLTHYVSADPPQWVLDRQSGTRVNSYGEDKP